MWNFHLQPTLVSLIDISDLGASEWESETDFLGLLQA
jgi:hypothetical protein